MNGVGPGALPTGRRAGPRTKQTQRLPSGWGRGRPVEASLRSSERRPSAELILRLQVSVGRAVYGRAETRAAMATFVSELEAAKKNLSEALGDNVKQ